MDVQYPSQSTMRCITTLWDNAHYNCTFEKKDISIDSVVSNWSVINDSEAIIIPSYSNIYYTTTIKSTLNTR